ncbi:ABC-F family ATP-binding cassette domain-containing protein (plasmid) [Geminicoccaceae bacterium 1502E]|nr:ABC-F family ATP-binding cassette domain-containing protein [Geminicoccaceae bacterium 1502E]
MLHLNDLTLRIAGRPLLEDATFHLPAGTRMALVGRNGTGKSTLLRLVAGELQPDAGGMRLQTGVRIGMVAQEAPGGRTTPLEAVLAADTERASLLAEAETATDPHRIAEVHTRLAEIGADAAPARAARILKGLGFDEAAQNRPLSAFSGGWRMRVALGAVLFLEPDLLLLDEPTNHLDLEAALWLEEHLRRYPRTLMLVSHDRDFLNTVPEKICHLEGRKLTVYAGGYDSFERQRREKLVLQEKARERQEAERARIQSFVDRFRYKASKARQAQSRLKMLERMQPLAAFMREPEIAFSFPASSLPAPPLVTMEKARAGYAGKVVLEGLDLRIDPDDRIALLGANGNGKSTLAKLIAGRIEALDGILTRARSLKVGFFAQHQIEDLMPDETPIRHVAARRPGDTEQQIRSRLARFGLGQQRAETLAGNLSGGEKTRLCFCLMCLDEPHILLLDEPTNHLDIDSREALVEAINDYPGAVILISHDRHLVELTADRLWLVADGRVRSFEGDLGDYRRLLLETSAAAASPAEPKGRPERLSGAERRSLLAPLRKRAREAELRVEKLAAELRRIEGQLADPATYGDGTDVAALQRRAAALGREMAEAETLWLAAEAEIEEVEAA